jgi:hypothetical protein
MGDSYNNNYLLILNCNKINILYLNIYNNSLRGYYFIKARNLRFYMGKGCIKYSIIYKIVQTPIL